MSYAMDRAVPDAPLPGLRARIGKRGDLPAGFAPGEMRDLAARIDSQFQTAGGLLQDVLSAIDLVSRQLVRADTAPAEGADALSEDGATEVLSRFAALLREVPTRNAGQADLLLETERVRRALSSSIAEIRRILQVLGIYGINIKIVASGSGGGNDLVQSMIARLAEGNANVDLFRKRLDGFHRTLSDLTALQDTLSSECTRYIPAAPDKLVENARALDRHEIALTDVRHSMKSTLGQMQSFVTAALVSLQIGDFTRQRMEHIAAGMELLPPLLKGASPQEVAAMSARAAALLLAQSESTQAALASGIDALTQAFHGLEPAAAALRSLREDGAAGAAGQALLAELEQSVAAIAAITDRLRQTDSRAAQVGRSIVDMVRDLTGSVGAISDLRRDVQQMAINIGLRYRGDDGTAKAAKIVAGEIHLYSRSLDNEASRIAASIAQLGQLSTQLEAAIDEPVWEASAFDSVIVGIRDQSKASQADLDAARQVMREMLDSLEKARGMLGRQVQMADRLRQMIATMGQANMIHDPSDLPEHFAADFCDRLFKMYTMAEEREVHKALMGEAVEAAPAASGGDDDDLDFILF